MAIVKHSRQREAILNELRSRKDHPTADELYFSLKTEYPNLSLGTVYRNLNLLADEGIILKISSDGADRFDATADNHYHFQCTKCGRLYDIDYPVINGIENEAQKIAGGKITSHQLTFIGICENCLQLK